MDHPLLPQQVGAACGKGASFKTLLSLIARICAGSATPRSSSMQTGRRDCALECPQVNQLLRAQYYQRHAHFNLFLAPSSEPAGSSDKTFSLTEVGPGCNGTPPMVSGIVWNPLRPSDGRRGSEFASYGVKHLKTWVVNDQVRCILTKALLVALTALPVL